jgi:uncharacterized membrane protein YgcG
MEKLRCLALATTLAACAPEYAYVPTTNAAMAGDRVAAQYSLPTSAPHGNMQLESYGFANMTANEEGVAERALHLRAIIVNNGGQDWTFDTRQQAIELEGQGPAAPVFASASGGATPPLVTIPPGGKRVVDLFFPVPAAYQKAALLPSFDAISRVQTDQGLATERTPFERVEITQPDSYYASGWDYGSDYFWGEPYWYNSDYYGYGGYGPVVGGRFYGHPMNIHRSGFGGRFAPRGGGFHGGGFHGGGGGHGGGGHR